MINFELKKMLGNGSLILFFIAMCIIFILNKNPDLPSVNSNGDKMDAPEDILFEIDTNERNKKNGLLYDEKLSGEDLLKEFKLLQEKRDALREISKSFKKVKGYPYGLKKYQEEDYEFNRDLNTFIEKYGLNLSSDERRILDYRLMEFEEAEKRDSYALSSTIGYSQNSVRNIIFNSRIFFGLPYFIVFFFCFSGIFSKERERGTLDFLYTEPLKRRKILLSKYIVLCIIPILYLIFLLYFPQ